MSIRCWRGSKFPLQGHPHRILLEISDCFIEQKNQKKQSEISGRKIRNEEIPDGISPPITLSPRATAFGKRGFRPRLAKLPCGHARLALAGSALPYGRAFLITASSPFCTFPARRRISGRSAEQNRKGCQTRSWPRWCRCRRRSPSGSRRRRSVGSRSGIPRTCGR